MGESLLGFNLLSSDNIHQALQYSQIIEGHNQNRQKIQTKIVSSIDLNDSKNQNLNALAKENNYEVKLASGIKILDDNIVVGISGEVSKDSDIKSKDNLAIIKSYQENKLQHQV